MLSRLSRQLSYANVMSTIAVFVAVGTGGAYAANTVFSTDIVDGEVKSVDIGNNEIGSSDVKDNTINTFDVHSFLGVDVADGSLTGADVENGSITGTDITNQSVASLDLNQADTGTVSDDPASVPAQSCIVETTGAIPGMTDGDFALLFPPPSPAVYPPGLVVANEYTLNDGALASYRLCNVTDAAIDAGSITFTPLIIANV